MSKLINKQLAVKICGLKNLESIEVACESGADFLGFIFYEKSPRNLKLNSLDISKLNQIIKKYSDKNKNIKKVAVTVDADNDNLQKIIAYLQPDFLQLHGNESLTRIKEIKQKFNNIKIIKAIKISEKQDLSQVEEFAEIADMILLDAKPTKNNKGLNLPGGNNISFDWNILNDFTCSKPWFLAGGINKNNVLDAIKISKAKFIDVSSGVEVNPGEKDINKIKDFFIKLKT